MELNCRFLYAVAGGLAAFNLVFLSLGLEIRVNAAVNAISVAVTAFTGLYCHSVRTDGTNATGPVSVR